MLCVYFIVNMCCIVICDVQIGEVIMKKGDIVLISIELVNFDLEVFDDLVMVDFLCSVGNVLYMVFFYGVYCCVGLYLVCCELCIVLELWLEKLLLFCIVDGSQLCFNVYGVFGMEELYL